MNDYERIAEVIRYLDAHCSEQPSLEDLARHAGLSPWHLHRLFTSWAGVTPKDFLQSLTLAHAKALLANGHSVLDAALEAGLSGPGRLHDLCITLEAASPGDLKSGGEGWQVTFGFHVSPFGQCIIAENSRGICYLAFLDGDSRGQAEAELRNSWRRAAFTRDDSRAALLTSGIFRPSSPDTATAPLRAFIRGTSFQVRVWNALLRVPPGSLTTYGRIAVSIGQRSAARAVGSAVGSNTLAYLIPCHRVIRETGAIGDYRWGTLRKRAILAWENVPTRQRPRSLCVGQT
jgi:AraC family transcriptional regulator of adaptative response/methylated-DNA-[protein]-cysteine methyltransferase